MPRQLTIEGQTAWEHDENLTSGFFHTYDALDIDPAYPYPRKTHVFLPASYAHGARHYPVAYMNDGHTAFFPGGFCGQSWNMAGALQDLYADRAAREMIVVAAHPVLRNHEYTHAWWHGDECCLLPVYARYLARSLKPFVDRHYRTLRGAADTMILGSSHGGLAAFYTAVRHADAFGFAACLSPSFWAGTDDASLLPRVIPTRLALKDSALLDDLAPYLARNNAAGTRPRLFLDWGLKRYDDAYEEDMEERAAVRGREMAALLATEHGYEPEQDLYAREILEGEHTEHSWGLRVREPLQLFGR